MSINNVCEIFSKTSTLNKNHYLGEKFTNRNRKTRFIAHDLDLKTIVMSLNGALLKINDKPITFQNEKKINT